MEHSGLDRIWDFVREDAGRHTRDELLYLVSVS